LNVADARPQRRFGCGDGFIASNVCVDRGDIRSNAAELREERPFIECGRDGVQIGFAPLGRRRLGEHARVVAVQHDSRHRLFGV
jgi:hypothetical protein